MSSPYLNLVNGVQGLRRQVEIWRCPVAGGLGVRAQAYPHQVGNVNRILTGTQIRHLLADEVGLGKTVQALMIINALRLHRPALRVLVVVPDELVAQWRDEILARAHWAPTELEPEPDEEGYVRLAWPEVLESFTEVDPALYDLLVVDELHRLKLGLQDRITAKAADFESVLILTATPNFQDVRRHLQLMAILEPERVARARLELGTRGRRQRMTEAMLSEYNPEELEQLEQHLVARDEAALHALQGNPGHWREEWGALPGSLDQAALAYCTYRRVVRTRRSDFQGVLPTRVYRGIEVEPTAAEIRRERLMWRYFRYLPELSRDFDTVALAKRVVLGGKSLLQRVGFLLRKGHEREDLLGEVRPLIDEVHGDSRLDALTDLLRDIWRHDPETRVLVAAQDNLTVDYLFKVIPLRLPQIGPRGQHRELVPACIRQGMETDLMTDLGGLDNDTNENLELFQRGEAQVLFAPDRAQVGLNLQRARVLVLYGVPWQPGEVEQWIGRLDRIGNEAAVSEDGEVAPVEVYTITRRGLVDAHVVRVLERFEVFQRSVNLDGAHLSEITERIEEVALSPSPQAWSALETSARRWAAEDRRQELDSPLAPHLPWGPQVSESVLKRLLEQPLPEPFLRPRSEDEELGSLEASDRAFEEWLRLLHHSKEYVIKWRVRDAQEESSDRYNTVWYQFAQTAHRRPPLRSQVLLSGAIEVNPHNHPQNRHRAAFISRRVHIQQPPRREVYLQHPAGPIRRELQFTGYGSKLDDDLSFGWALVGSESPETFELILPRDHPLLVALGPATYSLMVGHVDPARRVLAQLDTQELEAAVAAWGDHLGELASWLRASHEADMRWLRAELPAQLVVSLSRHAGGQWTPVSEAALARSLLLPFERRPIEQRPLPHSVTWSPPEAVLAGHESLASAHEASLRRQASEAWSHRLPALEQGLTVRRTLAEIEGADLSVLRVLELERAEIHLASLPESQTPVYYTARNQVERQTAVVHATRGLVEQRVAWLGSVLERARDPEVKVYRRALIRVQRGGN